MDNMEMIFETQLDTIYAPSAAPREELGFDPEFQKQLEAIPDKMAFKIGEVAQIADVKPYVLRYWQSEFTQLKPQKSKQGQRAYSKKDVELVLMIKKLLYKDRFSIEGARAALKNLRKETKTAKKVSNMIASVEEVRNQIEDLLDDVERIKGLFDGPSL